MAKLDDLPPWNWSLTAAPQAAADATGERHHYRGHGPVSSLVRPGSGESPARDAGDGVEDRVEDGVEDGGTPGPRRT